MAPEDNRPGNYVKTGMAFPRTESYLANEQDMGADPKTGTTESKPRGMGSAVPNNVPASFFAFRRPLGD